MKSSLKSLNYKINECHKNVGKTRLYIDNRVAEFFTEVEKLNHGKKRFSDQVLYVDEWSSLSKHLSNNLPQNILCSGAADIVFPEELKGHNIIFTTLKMTKEEVIKLAEETPSDYAETVFPKNLLDVLHEASLEKICQLTSLVCGNPVFILDFHFRSATISFFDTDSADIMNLCGETDAVGFVNYTHTKEAIGKIQKGEVLELPNKKIKFYMVPVMQSNVSVSHVLLVEDRVKFLPADLEVIKTAARGLEILEVGSRVLGDAGKPIYEYALTRSLIDEFGTFGTGATARFVSLGYNVKKNLRVIVLDKSMESGTYDAKAQSVILARQLRTVIGNYGLCTTLFDYIVIFLNMDNRERMRRILLDLRLFSSKNNLKVGISPWFSDIEEIKINHQRALDALSVGPVIMPDSVIFFQENLKMYKMVIDAFKNMPQSDLIPESLEKLISYDHAHNTEFVRTLYCHLQTLGNSKLAAEQLNIHRNTYFYRMDKIYEILGTKALEGNDFIELSIGYFVLEYIAKQNGKPLEFDPIHRADEQESL